MGGVTDHLQELRLRLIEIEAEIAMATPSRRASLKSTRDHILIAMGHADGARATENLVQVIVQEGGPLGRDPKDAAYWFERLYTSLLLGHGTFLSLLVANILSKDTILRQTLAAHVQAPLTVLTMGLAFAGLTPMFVSAYCWATSPKRPVQPDGSREDRLVLIEEVALIAAGVFIAASALMFAFALFSLARDSFGLTVNSASH